MLVTGFLSSDALGFRPRLEPTALMQGIAGERSGAPLCSKPASSPCSTVPHLRVAPLISVSAPVTVPTALVLGCPQPWLELESPNLLALPSVGTCVCI